jgi:hypothetical protein
MLSVRMSQRAKVWRKYCLLFVRLLGTVVAEGFQQVPCAQEQLAVLSCIEHERLEFELFEVRTRG